MRNLNEAAKCVAFIDSEEFEVSKKAGQLLITIATLFLIPAAYAMAPNAGQSCAVFLADPVITPDRPTTVPAKPKHDPIPIREPHPSLPRRAPNPLPDRPLLPTTDPKDIIPIDLYDQDGEMGTFWRSISPDVRSRLVHDADADFNRLSVEFQSRYGAKPNLQTVYSNVMRVLQRLTPIEDRHKIVLEGLVRQLIDERFGRETTEHLTSSISSHLPARPAQINMDPSSLGAESLGVSQTQNIDTSFMRFYVLRRELYNLLAQAEGWFGMHEFVNDHSKELYLIDPALPSLYSELDLNYRLANRLMLASIPSVQTIQGADMREQITSGREIVCVNCRPVQGLMGEKQIEIGSVTGVAVGKNAWALAHEAFKASFQIATALEATQRAPLNHQERQFVDDLTNSNAAEIRQGLMGPGFRQHMQKVVSALVGSSDPKVYFVIVERVFSMLPDKVFQSFIMDCIQFDQTTINIKDFRRKYNEYLLLDEFQ